MILVEYYIEKWENVLKFTFHGFAAHLKDYVSARLRKVHTKVNIIISEFNFSTSSLIKKHSECCG